MAMVAEGAMCRGCQRLRGLLAAGDPVRGRDRGAHPRQVLELQARALRLYPYVRVIPQTHKAIGQL